MTKNPKRLSHIEQRCVDEYFVDFCKTRAARRAGLKDSESLHRSAYNVFRRPHVVEEIERRMEQRRQEIQLDTHFVIEKLKNVVDRCLQAEPVMEWNYEEKKLVETGEWQFDSRGANKALEQLGKYLDIFNDNKLSLTLKNTPPIVGMQFITPDKNENTNTQNKTKPQADDSSTSME